MSTDFLNQKSPSMPPIGATAAILPPNDRSSNRLRMSQSFAVPSSPSQFAALQLPPRANGRPTSSVVTTAVVATSTSSPLLPRHRNRNPTPSFTSFPETELTLTRASTVGVRPRTATPVPRHKLDCSLVEGNETSNGSGGGNEVDGDIQSKSFHLEPNERQDLLAVPDSGRVGSRRSRSNEGIGKAPSKTSVSSGESVFLQNSCVVNGQPTDAGRGQFDGRDSAVCPDFVDPSAADAGKGHVKNKAARLAYKLIRNHLRSVATGVQ